MKKCTKCNNIIQKEYHILITNLANIDSKLPLRHSCWYWHCQKCGIKEKI